MNNSVKRLHQENYTTIATIASIATSIATYSNATVGLDCQGYPMMHQATLPRSLLPLPLFISTLESHKVHVTVGVPVLSSPAGFLLIDVVHLSVARWPGGDL